MSDRDETDGGEVLPFLPRVVLPGPAGASRPDPAPEPEPAGASPMPTLPSVEGMAPPLHLTMPGVPDLAEDEGAFSPPEPADPDNPTTGEAAATALALMVALSVAAAGGMWQSAALLRARAAHRRALADRARAEADKAAARNKASGGPGASGGAKSGGGGGRPLLGGGSGSSGRKSGSGSASGGPGRKTAGADKGSAGKAPAVPRIGGGSAKGPGSGGGSKGSDGKRPAGKAPAGGSKGPGSGSTGGGAKGGPHGGGSKSTDGKRPLPSGRARTTDPRGGAKGGPHGGGSKGADGKTKAIDPKGGAKTDPKAKGPDPKATDPKGSKDAAKGADGKTKAVDPKDAAKTGPKATDAKDAGAGRWEKWAEGRWHGRRDEGAKRTEGKEGGREDERKEEEWEEWARGRHEDWKRERERPPGFEGMRPPPAADRTVKVTVERMDTQPKARPGLAAPRPQLPAGTDRTNEGEPMSTPVRTSTRGTQYRDAELTVYDVIEADADMAEEIAAGAVVAVATADGCDALYTRLERLYVEVSGMQVPGSLQGKVLDLMAQTATVRDRAQAVAAALPAAAEAISTAGTNASARHRPLADAVRDAGHTRPAERDYHNE